MKLSHILLALVVSSQVLFAQNRIDGTALDAHNETPDHPYTEVDKSAMPRSAAYNVRLSSYFTTQVNVDENGNNIVGDAGNEPSLAVDPTNPDRIVVGWRQFDDISSNFRQAGYGYSLDGGNSFTFPGVINPTVFRSDPVLDFDSEGNLYYNSLQGDFSCDVYKIEDGGVVWDGPYPANGGDKQWMRIDKTDGIGAGNNYSNWNESFTTCAPGDFTRSTDGSETFETCITVDGDPRWGTLAVNSNGDLYISGISGGDVVLIKSTTAKDPSAAVTWDFVSTPDMDGLLNTGPPINPQGLHGQMWVDVDMSNDNVYMLGSVTRNSVNDPLDVMFIKSTDGGVTFAEPVRINTDDFGNYNWFGTMSVAPNGRIDVIWLDTRDAPTGTVDSVLYYSYSEDEGETWTTNEPISEAFDPTIGYPQQNKMGDYFDMVSDDNYAHVAWTSTINGGQDVYYTQITPEILSADNFEAASLAAVVSPNPFTDETTITFINSNEENTTVEVFDILGKRVTTLLDASVTGQQSISWKGTNEGGTKLASGLYFVSINSGKRNATLKVILK